MLTFDIIVPTHRRADSLRETLGSIENAQHPDALGRVIVIENGRSHAAQSICRSFSAKLDVQYLHDPQANAATARNRGIAESNADLLLFMDDDIQLQRGALMAYAKSFAQHGLGAFYGGPLAPDYEQAPEPWLLPFLPWSAKGHSLGDTEIFVESGVFMGGNFAAPRQSMLQIGGFDELSAIGKNSGGLGEENRCQQALLDIGLLGVYVPEALVHHRVPAEKCDPRFIRSRQRRHGYSLGYQLAADHTSGTRMCLRVPCWYWRKTVATALSALGSRLTRQSRSIKFERMLAFYQSVGQIQGYWRNATSLRLQSAAPTESTPPKNPS